jgi:hypothetical protein
MVIGLIATSNTSMRLLFCAGQSRHVQQDGNAKSTLGEARAQAWPGGGKAARLTLPIGRRLSKW